ncbi:hypothetical protein DFH09DRAFT_1096524 [Mycena vulgaris]|nr:hypothetical protein DFH09DRAFT_1096524 [Mycena vulgaris]
MQTPADAVSLRARKTDSTVIQQCLDEKGKFAANQCPDEKEMARVAAAPLGSRPRAQPASPSFDSTRIRKKHAAIEARVNAAPLGIRPRAQPAPPSFDSARIILRPFRLEQSAAGYSTLRANGVAVIQQALDENEIPWPSGLQSIGVNRLTSEDSLGNISLEIHSYNQRILKSASAQTPPIREGSANTIAECVTPAVGQDLSVQRGEREASREENKSQKIPDLRASPVAHCDSEVGEVVGTEKIAQPLAEII